MFMVYGSRSNELKKDFKKRILDFKSVKAKYWLFIFLLMPIVLLLSTFMSLFLGQSAEQFLISPELTIFGGETLIILIILVLAPTFEELGFRGYGIDSLKKNRTIIKTIFIYIVLWMLWHLPLYFIDGYYQNELLHENIVYAVNFVVQLSIAGFLMGWIYYKNNRSIIAMIIFHVMLNLFSVLLQTEQFTKCIITFNLLIISGIIFYFNKSYFLEKNEK
jgi:membrane protease YdiL (CAAX protease family)